MSEGLGPLGVTVTVADPGFSPPNWGLSNPPSKWAIKSSNGHQGGDPNHLPNLGWIWPSTDWEFCWCFFFRGSEPRIPEVISNHDFKLVLLSFFWSKVFLSICLFYWLFQKTPDFSEGVFGISNNQKTNSSTKWLILVWNYLAFYCRSLWSTRPKYGNIWNAIFNTTHTHITSSSPRRSR